MAHPQKHPLRPLSKQEERELRRIVKASSERIDVARRARVLLAVAAKQTFAQAASSTGFAEARSVSELVERFNEHGLAALSIAAATRVSSRRSSWPRCSAHLIGRKIRRRPGHCCCCGKPCVRRHCPTSPKKPYAKCCMRRVTATSARAAGCARAMRGACAKAARSPSMTWKRRKKKID